MKYLTKSGNGYALHVHVGNEDAPAVNVAIEAGVLAFDGNKSKLVRECIKSGVQESVAQKYIKLALEICDEFSDPDYALYHQVYQSVKIIRMALTGCPTRTNREFTGELSEEYIERYGDDDE